MIATSHSRIGRIAISGATLIAVGIVFSSAACASAGWTRAAAYQSTTDRGRIDVIPGNWEQVDGLPAGTRVAVTLKTGERVAGRFKARRPEAVVVSDPAGKELIVPTSEVLKIAAPRDKLTNGALIGAGIGFGTAVAVLAIAGWRWLRAALGEMGGAAAAVERRQHRGDARRPHA